MKRLILTFALPALFAGSIWSAGGGTARAADPTRYVSPSGMDNPTCDKQHPCQHVQHAVDVATPGDTIVLASGTYVEQVTIAKSLKVRGSGVDKSNIKAPDAKTQVDANGKTYIVLLNGGATVDVSDLTVRGPGGPGGGLNCAPNPLSLDKGVEVAGGATLNLSNAAVRDVYDQPASGCQRGDAISIGTACFSGCIPDVGHAVIHDALISIYQKNGVAVRGAGSTLTIRDSAVVNMPSSVIASNGVEVLSGALATITNNAITGNECNLTPACGPNPTNDQGSGILLAGSASNTEVSHDQISANDIGIYTDDRATVTHNADSGNRYENMFVDSGATGAQITHNRTDGGNYGIYVNSGNAGGNTFAHDSAHHNSVYDFYFGGGAPSVFKHNSCDTAFPSKSFWDCTSDNGGNGDNGNGDNGNGNGNGDNGNGNGSGGD